MELNKLTVMFKHTAGGLKTPKVEEGEYAFDVYASEDVIVSPSESKLVKTNTIFDVPSGYALMILPAPAVSDKTPLRFANSIHFVDSSNRNEVNVLLENVRPLPMRKAVAPEYSLVDGTRVEGDYARGYLPIGSVLVQKGDIIGRGVLVRVEPFSLSRTTKKVQE